MKILPTTVLLLAVTYVFVARAADAPSTDAAKGPQLQKLLQACTGVTTNPLQAACLGKR